MSDSEYTEEVKARARVLAQELRDKIEKYFPEPYDEGRMGELIALRKELDSMGFIVSWRGTLDPETAGFEVVLNLYYKPKPNIIPFKKPAS